eukprot:jgi/Hompol1/958/HPOL_002617-RA
MSPAATNSQHSNTSKLPKQPGTLKMAVGSSSINSGPVSDPKTSHQQFNTASGDADGTTSPEKIDGFLKAILKRQDEIESIKPAAQSKLEQLKQAVETRDTSLISFELNNAQSSAQTVEDAKKLEDERKAHIRIHNGLLKIKELDMMLREKIHTARSLKKERILRESANGTPEVSNTSRPLSYHNTLSDDEDDDEEFELRSVHSTDSNTFITEPKLFIRPKVGRESLESKNAYQADPVNTKKKKGYTLGNFIERNIALGPDARYYSAMTEEEMDRVNRLLLDTDENNDDARRDLSTATPHSDRETVPLCFIALRLDESDD